MSLPPRIAAVLDIRAHRRWHARAPLPRWVVGVVAFAAGVVVGMLVWP